MKTWDPWAAAAAAIALVMIAVYLAVVDRQDGQVALWFVEVLALAALLAVYGSARVAPRRRIALTAAGVLLLALGLLGILSIGLPIVLAGALAVVAAVRMRTT